MGISLTNLLVILIIVLVIFGAGKLPKVMGDLGKGIKNFRDELNDKEEKNSKLDDKNKQNQKEEKTPNE